MGVTANILRSRAVAALTSPHGVDRYLELVNPMWAAREVRARVVDVRRETSGEHPVATITLQPTSTWRAWPGYSTCIRRWRPSPRRVGMRRWRRASPARSFRGR